MFVLGAFVAASVAQELWRGIAARRAISHEAPPIAFVQLIRRNRRRYGGYIVHFGLAVLLIGVAGSSSFQHSDDVTLAPGQHANVDGYAIRYVRPTAAVGAQKITFGAVLDVSKAGKHVTTLDTTRGFYPSTDSSLGVIGRFFGGEADSNVGLQDGLDPRHLDHRQPRPDAASAADQSGKLGLRSRAQPGHDDDGQREGFTGRGERRISRRSGRSAIRRSPRSPPGTSPIPGRSNSCSSSHGL